ncbi:hypothetical protein F53441_1224 [Fusarium austroafricanum]|uniref:Methyltransferase n=1 Tax=Fusarium austroafricanum TaxID=2364996 RepID=A0A8H4KVV7_9HYPO|nr:hypothetical protein F53441_1224 [Fusarium austroafricanum]
MAAPTQELHETLAADTFEDGDLTFSGLMVNSEYSFPNDESESGRLDLQHNLWLLTLQGELDLSPKIKESAKRVLDVGTGTDIWAIEYGVPPNCIFEIGDLEKEWTWTEPFDFIFSRLVTGSFADIERFIQKSYDNLEPGGYLEMQDLTYPITCDDGTLPSDRELLRSGKLSIEASAKAGRAINLAPKYKSFLEKACFTEAVDKQSKWPMNEWPKDKHYKELGKRSHANINSGLEGLTLGLFTRFLGWSADEVRVFCSAMRKQLRDRSIHAYIPV